MGNVLSVCLSRPRRDPVFSNSDGKNKSKRIDDPKPTESVDNLKTTSNDVRSDDTPDDALMFDASQKLGYVRDDDRKEKKISFFANIRRLVSCVEPATNVGDAYVVKEAKPTEDNVQELPAVEEVSTNAEARPSDNNDVMMFDASKNLGLVHEDRKEKKASLFAYIRRLVSCVDTTTNFGDVYVVKEAKPENTVNNLQELPVVEEVASNAEAKPSDNGDDTSDALKFDASDNVAHVNEDLKEKKKISMFAKIRRLVSCVEPATNGDVLLVKEAKPENTVVNFDELSVIVEVTTNEEARPSENNNDTNSALNFDAQDNLPHVQEDRKKKKKVSFFSKIRRLVSCAQHATNVSDVYMVKEAEPENTVINIQQLPVVEEVATNTEASANPKPEVEDDLKCAVDESDDKHSLSSDVEVSSEDKRINEENNKLDDLSDRITNGHTHVPTSVVRGANSKTEVEDDLECPVDDSEDKHSLSSDVEVSNEDKTINEENNKLDDLSDRITNGHTRVPTSVVRGLAQDMSSVDSRVALQSRRPPSRFGVQLELGLAAHDVNRELPSLFRRIAQTNPPTTPLVEGIARVNRYRQIKLLDSRVRMADRHERDMKFRQRMREYRQRMSKIQDVDEDSKDE